MLSLLAINLVCTVFMVGLIWFVQIVHYPLMARVGIAEYPTYQKSHETRTGIVVMPVMLAELGVALLLAWVELFGDYKITGTIGLASVNLGLLAGIWASTFFLQVPQHTILGRGFEPRAHHQLVFTNWIRTLLWTAKACVALAMLLKVAPK